MSGRRRRGHRRLTPHLSIRTFYDEELESSDRFYSNQHQLFQLGYALYNILAAR